MRQPHLTRPAMVAQNASPVSLAHASHAIRAAIAARENRFRGATNERSRLQETDVAPGW